MTKRHLSKQQQRRIRAAQTRSLADAITAAEDTVTGTVIARYGKRALVEDAAGDRWQCDLRSHVEGVVAGDTVAWQRTSDGGVIHACSQRRSVLSRPDGRGRLRPIAANIDMMLIVIAPRPEPHSNLIDRYLVAANAVGVEAALILNKIDLLTHDSTIEVLADRYSALGYPLIKTSALIDSKAEHLGQLIAGRTIVLVGQSGVGKSSLIKRLIPDLSIRIGELSAAIAKGRHTTTAAELYHLPAGGQLIDSPGIREFNLHHLPPDEVARGFVEFQPLLGHCRFRDCQHGQETDCALKAAVARGEISAERFASYHRIVDSATQ